MNRTELLQIAKPILFNTEMVRAILDGRKTVTRRIVKIPSYIEKESNGTYTIHAEGTVYEDKTLEEVIDFMGICSARYKKDDILYVRETWQEKKMLATAYFYKADKETNALFEKVLGKWHPSIHMPKKAARIFLRVTDVKVERLQNITEEQAECEGVDITTGMYDGYGDGIEMFEELWNSTIKKSQLDTLGWDANPWVWVYKFEKLEIE